MRDAHSCLVSFGFTAARLAPKFTGAPWVDITEAGQVDILFVATPDSLHAAPTKHALENGIHVMVEKPVEITTERVDAIIEACQKNGVTLGAIFPRRFQEASRVLKKTIESGRFGKIAFADAYIKWFRTQEYYDSGGWRGTFAMDGGGAYMNKGIHNVDLLYWLMGDVAEVDAFTDTLAHKRIEVEDAGAATLRFANGALGVLVCSTSVYPSEKKRTEIHGTEGSAIVELDSVKRWEFAKSSPKDRAVRDKLMHDDDDDASGGSANPADISHTGHRDQLKDFIRAIERGTKAAVDGEEGRKSVELILAIYKAAWTGKVVKLPLKSDPKPPKP